MWVQFGKFESAVKTTQQNASGADKSLGRPEVKQATATTFHIYSS